MACTPVTETCTAIPGDFIPIITADCPNPISPGPAKTALTVNDAGTGFCWRPTHLPVVLTNTAAAFEWDQANQCGNIPITKITGGVGGGPGGSTVIDIGDGTSVTINHPTLTANADGSYTYDPHDGSATTTIPKDCCPTLVDNGDGTYTFTPGNGGAAVVITVPATTAETITTLIRNTDGSFTYTSEDGTTTTIPADVAETITTLVNNGDQTFTYTNEAGTLVTIDICDEAQKCIDVGAANRQPSTNGQSIPGGGATTTLIVTNMIADTTGTSMDGLPNGVTIARTQRYDGFFRGFFSGAAPNVTGVANMGVMRSGAFVRYDGQQFVTDVNGNAELRVLFLASLMFAGDLVVVQVTWNGATTGSIVNTNIRVAGHFKPA